MAQTHPFAQVSSANCRAKEKSKIQG